MVVDLEEEEDRLRRTKTTRTTTTRTRTMPMTTLSQTPEEQIALLSRASGVQF